MTACQRFAKYIRAIRGLLNRLLLIFNDLIKEIQKLKSLYHSHQHQKVVKVEVYH